jgi:hypothetical protein
LQHYPAAIGRWIEENIKAFANVLQYNKSNKYYTGYFTSDNEPGGNPQYICTAKISRCAFANVLWVAFSKNLQKVFVS